MGFCLFPYCRRFIKNRVKIVNTAYLSWNVIFTFCRISTTYSNVWCFHQEKKLLSTSNIFLDVRILEGVESGRFVCKPIGNQFYLNIALHCWWTDQWVWIKKVLDINIQKEVEINCMLHRFTSYDFFLCLFDLYYLTASEHFFLCVGHFALQTAALCLIRGLPVCHTAFFFTTGANRLHNIFLIKLEMLKTFVPAFSFSQVKPSFQQQNSCIVL